MHYRKWHLANNIIIIHSCALLLFGWAAFRLQPCLEEIQRDLPVRLHILSSTEPIWQRITTAARLTNNLAEIWDRSATASGHRPVPSHCWVRVFIAADAVLAQPCESLVYVRARKMNCEGGGTKINHFLRWPEVIKARFKQIDRKWKQPSLLCAAWLRLMEAPTSGHMTTQTLLWHECQVKDKTYTWCFRCCKNAFYVN